MARVLVLFLLLQQQLLLPKTAFKERKKKKLVWENVGVVADVSLGQHLKQNEVHTHSPIQGPENRHVQTMKWILRISL